MFERYVEKSRKAIFFARYEAHQARSESIETEHLLLGILRTDQELVQRLLPPESIESIGKRIRATGKKISTAAVDLPLSKESKRVLERGAERQLAGSTRISNHSTSCWGCSGRTNASPPESCWNTD